MRDSIFSLTDVCVKRQGKLLVENINWEVKPGENWVLLGPNGIGKSTIINIIATRMFPTSGSVEILGNELGKFDVFSIRDRIGVLSADFSANFNNNEKVLDIVALGRTSTTALWGDERDEALLNQENITAARDMLEQFGVLRIANSNWGVLSQGERKRVQMARVLVSDPDLILLDEPTAGLDLSGREYVVNTLNKMASINRNDKRDRAIILVNHNVEEIPPSFDKIAIMGAISKEYNAPGTLKYCGDIKTTLNSKNLSSAYGIDLTVQKTANLRYFASSSVILEQKVLY
ncbi:MAG: ATP-binding cassette domain-containing protein [Candidatus Ancillula sp.]|jgi:iron complex transport system ATP-binding protein|nr:ATP-binding cassette domain-containing protein [Candidatus Ancillula sp.]